MKWQAALGMGAAGVLLITSSDTYQEDVQYLRALGLCSAANPLRVANPIYREVIARVLAGAVEIQVEAEPKSFVLPDGRLDFDRLLREFHSGRARRPEVPPGLEGSGGLG